jgi:Na+/phosphate symporter
MFGEILLAVCVAIIVLGIIGMSTGTVWMFGEFLGEKLRKK